MLSVSVALKGPAVPFTAYLHDSKAFIFLSSSIVLLKTQRLKLWYHQKKKISRTGIFFVVLCLLINGCYILFDMVVHDTMRSLVLRFRGT